MRQTITPYLPLLICALFSCSGGSSGGSSPSSTSSTNWIEIHEQEPNDELGDEQELGTVTSGLAWCIQGQISPGDADLFGIECWDYLNVSFELVRSAPGCDIDLIVYDDLWGVTDSSFEDVPPPATESGSFELQPNNQFVLVVLCYGEPSPYELKIRFNSSSSATVSPEDSPGLQVVTQPTPVPHWKREWVAEVLGLDPDPQPLLELKRVQRSAEGWILHVAPLGTDAQRESSADAPAILWRP